MGDRLLAGLAVLQHWRTRWEARLMILAFGRWILPGLLDLVAIGVVVVAEVRDGADWLLEKASGGGSVYVSGGFGRGFGCYWSEASVGGFWGADGGLGF
ncbi:hypothetical protein QQ045_006607 [Rhodiola kirilowii]